MCVCFHSHHQQQPSPETPSMAPAMWEEGVGHGEGFQLTVYTVPGAEAKGVQGQLALIMTLGTI